MTIFSPGIFLQIPYKLLESDFTAQGTLMQLNLQCTSQCHQPDDYQSLFDPIHRSGRVSILLPPVCVQIKRVCEKSGKGKSSNCAPSTCPHCRRRRRLPATLLCAHKWGEREARALTLRRCCQRFSAPRAFLITAAARVDLSDAERSHLARSFASIRRYSLSGVLDICIAHSIFLLCF